MSLNFNFPLEEKYRKISSPFGWRWIFGKWGFHGGNDYPCPSGTPIYAPYKGIYWYEADRWRAGKILVIKHPSCGNVYTAYYHLQNVVCMPGKEIKQGDIIAYTDNTGAWTIGKGHLHWGLLVDGRWCDPRLCYS